MGTLFTKCKAMASNTAHALKLVKLVSSFISLSFTTKLSQLCNCIRIKVSTGRRIGTHFYKRDTSTFGVRTDNQSNNHIS